MSTRKVKSITSAEIEKKIAELSELHKQVKELEAKAKKAKASKPVKVSDEEKIINVLVKSLYITTEQAKPVARQIIKVLKGKTPLDSKAIYYIRESLKKTKRYEKGEQEFISTEEKFIRKASFDTGFGEDVVRQKIKKDGFVIGEWAKWLTKVDTVESEQEQPQEQEQPKPRKPRAKKTESK